MHAILKTCVLRSYSHFCYHFVPFSIRHASVSAKMLWSLAVSHSIQPLHRRQVDTVCTLSSYSTRYHSSKSSVAHQCARACVYACVCCVCARAPGPLISLVICVWASLPLSCAASAGFYGHCVIRHEDEGRSFRQSQVSGGADLFLFG